ncbi:conserved hypothetical protein [metagenome]|uniref:Cell division protein FtsL n=1 Tax=metagenome TaxID=256318 RepID=A0A2P2BZZ0_9ZZZZ
MSSPAPQFRTRMPRLDEAVDRAFTRARLTVVPRVRSRAPRIPFVTLVTVIMLGGVVGLLIFNTSMQQSSFATTNLQQEATALGLREQTLQMELEDLRDPQRVALKAQQMGMVPVGTPAFLDLDTGKVLGKPAPTAAGELRIRPYGALKPKSLNPPPTIVTVRPGEDTDNTDGTGNSTGDTDATSPDGRSTTGRNE